MDTGAGDDDSANWTRRRLLSAAVAGGLGASLAGCTETNDIVDSPQVFGHPFPYTPSNVSVNPWAVTRPDLFLTMLYEAKSHGTRGRQPELGDIVESLDIDGPTATVTFSEGFSWWNGDPVTARDQWVKDRLQSFVGDLPGPSVERGDEYTLRYEFEAALDRRLVVSRAARDVVDTPASVFEPWVGRFDDATTDAARDDLIDGLRSVDMGLERIREEGLGNGPYQLAEVSINRLMLERYDDHPRASDLSIPRLWFPVIQEISIEDLINQGWIDGGRGLLANRRGTPPENLEQLASYHTTGGIRLATDWRNDHLARRGVRRAIACVLPLDLIGDIEGQGDATTLQTGLAKPETRRWLDEGLRDQLHRYPVERDDDRAAAYLREAGYTIEDGDWYGPDGRQPDLTVVSPDWSGWVSAGRGVAQSLAEFGFETDFDPTPNTNVYNDLRNHNYDLMLWSFDGRPHFAYDVGSDQPTALGYGVTDPGTERSETGKPVTVSVPEQPGAIDADESDRRTVNLVETWWRLRGQTDAATTREAVATFATWWNDALPDMTITTSVGGLWANTHDFSWPAYDDPVEYATTGPGDNPVYHLLKHGAIEPAGGE